MKEKLWFRFQTLWIATLVPGLVYGFTKLLQSYPLDAEGYTTMPGQLFILGGIVITIALIYNIVFVVCRPSSDKRRMKIKFTTFLSWYNLNSKAFKIEDDYLPTRKDIMLYFGAIDFIFYCIWHRRRRLKKFAEIDVQDAKTIIAAVQKDIDWHRAEGERIRNEEYKKMMERLGKKPNPARQIINTTLYENSGLVFDNVVDRLMPDGNIERRIYYRDPSQQKIYLDLHQIPIQDYEHFIPNNPTQLKL